MADNADFLNQLSAEQKKVNQPDKAPVAEAPLADAPQVSKNTKAPVKEQ
jgi:hypothetical protein